MVRDKWWSKEMDFIQAKDLTKQLMSLCEDPTTEAEDIVFQSEREDYAEALRVVLDYLP